MAEATPEHPDWTEERLRYQVLRYVYDHTGGDCTSSVEASGIGAGVGLRYEDLFRTLYYLESHQFVFALHGTNYCITPKGIRYIERGAGRRQTIRAGTHF